MKTSDDKQEPKLFDPWQKITHAWDKPETVDAIEQYNHDALPEIEDFLAVLEDFEKNEPDLIDILLIFQDPETLLDEGGGIHG